MPFIIKATSLALKEFPILNSSLDQGKENIILKVTTIKSNFLNHHT
jgi:pyruvate/2-oxoglutarate dehydrogenase complex dihydrolipoamide acyltransferase (E2) component